MSRLGYDRITSTDLTEHRVRNHPNPVYCRSTMCRSRSGQRLCGASLFDQKITGVHYYVFEMFPLKLKTMLEVTVVPIQRNPAAAVGQAVGRLRLKNTGGNRLGGLQG